MNRILASKIKKARKDSKMSQKELGEALSVSDKAISSYESGRAIPTIPTVQKLAKITHKPVSYFVSTEEESTEYNVASLLKQIETNLEEVKKLLDSKD